ncbi:MAG: type VI secretion system contractile sheath large subunit [Planctomycetota bacterium]|jgi:type VI secretion system protein ImpC
MAEEKKEQKEAQAAEAVAIEPNEFDKLLKKEFKPKTDHARDAISSAVRTLAEQALAETTLVSDDSVNTIEAIIAQIDKKLSEQINMIMHHEDFTSLEGSWRGLHHLVNNTETDETLKIRVLNLSKKDLAKTIKKYKGTAWDQSPLFKKLYEEEYGSPGGEPYGCLVGDYYFDHSPPDVEILNGVAQISAASHSPFISAANPTLMNMDSWQELSNPRDLTKIFQTADYAPWRSLRDSDDSRYVSLTMPRFLGRLPYGAKTNPCEEFDYEEDTGGGDHSKYLWVNAAYAMGANINRSFKEFGWCARIRGVESGGMVEGLPCHTFPTDDGGVDMKCPAKNGLMPLSHWKNEDYACFIGAQSLQKPTEYDDADATANAKLAARLPYLFATCRFAHFLKCIVRDKIGSFKERDDMANWLNKWITQYVTSDPNASEEVKAQYPLAAAEVVVDDVEGDPGYYSAKFFLRPHYQLEGLSVSLRLVSKLPSVKKGG